jgi:hypothetical protein
MIDVYSAVIDAELAGSKKGMPSGIGRDVALMMCAAEMFKAFSDEELIAMGPERAVEIKTWLWIYEEFDGISSQ